MGWGILLDNIEIYCRVVASVIQGGKLNLRQADEKGTPRIVITYMTRPWDFYARYTRCDGIDWVCDCTNILKKKDILEGEGFRRVYCCPRVNHKGVHSQTLFFAFWNCLGSKVKNQKGW